MNDVMGGVCVCVCVCVLGGILCLHRLRGDLGLPQELLKTKSPGQWVAMYI